MFEKTLFAATILAVLAPFALLPVAAVWLWRNGQSLSRLRRIVFAVGLCTSATAYASLFGLRWYFHHAHLGFWPEVHVTSDASLLMMCIATLSFTATSFGKSYGRIAGCVASGSTALMWLISGVGSL